MKIGILSFGEAASQIAEYAISKGYQVVVANTAKLDLNKLKNVPTDCKIHLEGWEGAGRNREEGKEAALVHSELIAQKVETKFNDCDMVFVAGSCGGGTGSGALPIGIEIVSTIKNYVGVITTLPDINESIRAQMNTLECFSELSQFEQLGSVFVLDNEKLRQSFPNKSKKELHNFSNTHFIDNLSEISRLTSQDSYLSNFDKKDFLDITNERGCTTISKIHIPAGEIKTDKDLAKMIQDSWLFNPHPIGEQGQIVKAAILAKMPEKATKLINRELIFETVGMPYDIMEGYYYNEGHDNHYTIYTILSGLSFPNERLAQMESLSQQAEQKLVKQIEVARTQTFSTNNWTSKFNRDTKKETQKESLKERLAKFR